MESAGGACQGEKSVLQLHSAAQPFRGRTDWPTTVFQTQMTFVQKHHVRLFAALVAMLFAAVTLTSRAETAKATPFDHAGMWIWYVDQSNGGDLSSIIKQARKSDIRTLYIKSGDGTDTWSQFNGPLLDRLHRAGFKVCGWQYIYGDHPGKEAKVSAVAKKRGADCFVIDAESEFEGKYSAADHYIRVLRERAGKHWPVALAAFPYTDYHPAFPYSVFLGPGAATVNAPQLYWKAIGDTVREAVDHTWYWNDLYDRPINPVGQTYDQPRRKELIHFRRYMDNYGAAPSWWDWQETTTGGWAALGADTDGGFNGYDTVNDKPTMQSGDRGDQVVWLQQHLVGAGFDVPITGIFGGGTKKAVKRFQADRGLGTDGVAGTQTWNRLLKVKPVRVNWYGARSRSRKVGGAAASATGGRSEPLTANMPAVRDEIAGAKKPGQP